MITEAEVKDAQAAWSSAIKSISKASRKRDDVLQGAAYFHRCQSRSGRRGCSARRRARARGATPPGHEVVQNKARCFRGIGRHLGVRLVQGEASARTPLSGAICGIARAHVVLCPGARYVYLP